LPFAAFTIGKAFRNEISPRKWITRMREFTQAEGQIFLENDEFEIKIDPNVEVLVYPAEYQEKGHEPEKIKFSELEKHLNSDFKTYLYAIYIAKKIANTIGLDIRLRQHKDNEKAHYAKDAWDVEVFTSYGWLEVAGIHDRGKYDTDLEPGETLHKTTLAIKAKRLEASNIYKKVYTLLQTSLYVAYATERLLVLDEALHMSLDQHVSDRDRHNYMKLFLDETRKPAEAAKMELNMNVTNNTVNVIDIEQRMNDMAARLQGLPASQLVEVLDGRTED
jgi:glycyl-tRNA synthetase (class II)